MRLLGWLTIIAWTCSAGLRAEEGCIVVGEDGSATVRFPCGASTNEALVFRFGLPRVPTSRTWREGGVLRSLWMTNGIHYRQTVLVSGFGESASETNLAASLPPVLLVNIEGHNTNAEYAEAFAELAVESQGKRQELELKDGLVWRLQGQSRSLLGALEIPESGVKVSRGDVLRFSGNMPPSLKGSMTLKVPLEPLPDEAAAERLKDLEFEGELRRLAKFNNPPRAPSRAHLLFAPAERR